jgi:hypothetical protein
MLESKGEYDMRNLYTIAATSIVALALAGCTSSGGPTPQAAFEMDVEKQCNLKQNSIEDVLANAKTFNAAAIKEKVEFRRLGINNSDLIIAVEEGLKSGAKEVEPKTFKGKPSKQKFDIGYAAERACKFGLSALQFKHEGKSTWRAAVPGDGYSY